MLSLFITPAAEDDLIAIWLYIARDNPTAADQVYEEAQKTMQNLVEMPCMGTSYRPRREKLKGVRFCPIGKFKKYIVYYRQQSQGIEIIRVLHARMDKAKWLEQKNVP